MKNRTLLSALLLLFSGMAIARKDTCKLGLYVNSVYDFDLEDKSLTADFWRWMNYKNDSLKFDDALELPNSKTAAFTHDNYFVESIVPSTTTNTLMDNVHNLTFTFMLTVGIILISLYLHELNGVNKRRNFFRLDRWAFFSIIIMYMLINMPFGYGRNSR